MQTLQRGVFKPFGGMVNTLCMGNISQYSSYEVLARIV